MVRGVSCNVDFTEGSHAIRRTTRSRVDVEAMNREPTPPIASRAKRAGGWVLPSALLLPLGTAFVLVHYHRRAQEMQEAAVRRATMVYSGVVAWQFARSASTALHRATDAAIYTIGRGASGAVRIRPADRASLVFSADTSRPVSPVVTSARSIFRYDFETGELVAVGPASDPPEPGREVGSVGAAAKFGRRTDSLADDTGRYLRALFPDSLHDPHHLRFRVHAGTTRATIYGLVRGDGDRVRAVYGVEADPDIFAALLDSVLRTRSLLPPALMPSGLRHDQLRVTLTTAAAETVFTLGSARGNALSATDTLESERGGLRATVELDSAFAAGLVVGDVTSPPLRLIALLLTLSAVLAVAAVVQVRRTRALGELRSQFVANVSHELRTPLTHISMFAETLMRYPERSSDERFRFASIIHREAHRLTNLVDGVLRFSRLDAGRDTITAVPMDLAAEVREAIEVFRPMLDGARASLNCDIPERAPILGDASAIRQIIVNLLDNAIKHGSPGQTVTVRVRVLASGVALEVSDEGIGIPAEQRERVLEPFARLGEETGRKVAGAGLGLAVVRSLVELHGGRLAIDDAVGGGTIVRIDLAVA